MNTTLSHLYLHREPTHAGQFIMDPQTLDTTGFLQLKMKKGQILFSEGMTPHQLFFVYTGLVKVFTNGFDGKEQILKVATPGTFIGYRQLLLGSRYEVSAETVEPSLIRCIPKEDFMDMYQENPVVRRQFCQLLCSDVGELENKLITTAYSPIPSRLADALLKLSQNGESYSNPIRLTRTDLAHYIATTKESVIRLISELKDKGIVEATRNQILVINPKALLRIRDLNY
jgi:CRP-like cAMP-binding protein